MTYPVNVDTGSKTVNSVHNVQRKQIQAHVASSTNNPHKHLKPQPPTVQLAELSRPAELIPAGLKRDKVL